MENDRVTDVAALLLQGRPRPAVVAEIRQRYGVSRATAYRLIVQAEQTLPPEYHHPIESDDGTVDTLAEAERHYRLALQNGNAQQARLWLGMVHRFSLDAARLRPFEAWDRTLGDHNEPPF